MDLVLKSFLFTQFIPFCLAMLDVSSGNVNGGWSPWSVFGKECDQECDGGRRIRMRSCTLPSPQGSNGLKCLTDSGTRVLFDKKEEACNEEPCWGGNWTTCDCNPCTIGSCTVFALCGNGTCEGTQSQSKELDCNAWNITTCPSPCENVTCPEYGSCVDTSTEERPSSICECTMGFVMNEDKTLCMRPPPTEPTRRPIPTLPAAQKTVAVAVSKTASIVLIVFVGFTLLIFLVMKVFTPDRIIQMNMEIALILAHSLLMFPYTTYENQILCKVVSIGVHFFFTACFNFMMLEALHMYSLVAYVVKRGGMLTPLQNIFAGWGFALIIILFCICFEYKNYGGEYHCWLQMDTTLMLGQLIPFGVICTVTLTLIEAAGSSSNYKPLQGMDQDHLLSAKISQRSNLIILFLVIAHMITGMYSEYEQNLGLYGTFFLLNGLTGFVVFLGHCAGSQKLRNKFKQCWRRVSQKQK